MFGGDVTMLETRIPSRPTPLYYGVSRNDPAEFELIFGTLGPCPLDRFQAAAIAEWLIGPKEYCWLHICQPDLDYVRYRCIVSSLEQLPVNNNTVAFLAKIRCDGPYAYSAVEELEIDSSSSAVLPYTSPSNIQDPHYPVMTLELRPGADSVSVWPTIKPYLTQGKALYFSHGFAITWSDRTGVVPPTDIDVIMVAPKGSGTSLRTMFLEGRGLNSSYAIYQDVTGKAYERTIALGIGIGSGYLFETTFQREATSDLTGERGSLMGAIQGLLLAQYEVLRENGHSPSEAFNETVEELTQSLMPLFAKNGMDWMYANCSTTAQRGALDWMTPFHDAIKPVVEKLYHSVKTGNEAQISIDSNSKPDYREKLEEELKALRESEMWQTAVTVRKLRPENN